MKTIKWKGSNVLTRFGLMSRGRVISIPDKAADSYVEQKLASYEEVKSIKTKEENS